MPDPCEVPKRFSPQSHRDDAVNVRRESETPLGVLSASDATATVRAYPEMTANFVEADKS
jgi:hypothetical protein